MVKHTLVLGGARSGKSLAAERLVRVHGSPAWYIAAGVTLDQVGDDADLAHRVDLHRARRGDDFVTVEAGVDLVAALREHTGGPALIDSLGTWVAATWSDEQDDFCSDATALTTALAARSGPTVVVSDEVGLSVHPETAAGRRFRDALGTVNQAVADACDEVWLVVAGRGLRLDRLP